MKSTLTTSQQKRIEQLMWQEIIEPTTDAELDVRRKTGKDKVWVQINIMARIGCLYLIRNREPHHEETAARFKGMSEALLGNGLGASDTAREPVDTSLRAHDNGMANAIDHGEALRRAEQSIPKNLWDAVNACVYMCIPPGQQISEHGMSKRQFRDARKAKSQDVLDGLDLIAEVWNLKSKSRAA